MINFQDFFPEVAETDMFGQPKMYESMKSVMVKVNQWMVDRGIDLISIETLILPIRSVHKNRLINETETLVTGHDSVRRFQVVRVWYKD